MYKVFKADKDAYITDRVVNDVRMETANVGSAGSLDLFKLYGITASGSNPNIELSRLLVHFDLDPLRDLVTDGRINTNNGSFSCHLKLFDVYGGQPTPRDFRVTVHPLSRSFDEGLGRDVVLYGDSDVCNFLTGSRDQGPWILSGANAGGANGADVDYVVTTAGQSLEQIQLFTTGQEDLYVDVTQIVSATLANLVPDEGFRIALTSSLEIDTRTYFVKRFASRTAYNSDKHPQLIVRYDDSIQDDTNNVFFDVPGNIFLYNYVQGTAANLTSGSGLTQITGSNSLMLRMITAVSGGFYSTTFSASAHGTGIYSSSVLLSSNDSIFAGKLLQSGTVAFTPVWGSLDGTVSFFTGSTIVVRPPTRGSSVFETKRYTVTLIGLKPEHDVSEMPMLRVNIFDPQSNFTATRVPFNLTGEVIRSVYYAIRDVATNIVSIPFDQDKNSTRVSSDGSGMYFQLDISNLNPGRSYVIDVMIVNNGSEQVYRNASPPFRVVDMS